MGSNKVFHANFLRQISFQRKKNEKRIENNRGQKGYAEAGVEEEEEEHALGEVEVLGEVVLGIVEGAERAAEGDLTEGIERVP